MRFFSGLPEFIPYCRKQIVTTSTPGIYTSVYIHCPVSANRRGHHPERPLKAIAVVFNDGPERTIMDLRIDPKPIGLDHVTREVDAEMGGEFSHINRRVNKKREVLWGESGPGKCTSTGTIGGCC